MDIPSGITALLIVFSGASGNLNGVVGKSVQDVMQEKPVISTVSGSGADKSRVDGLSRPFTPDDMSRIAILISEKSKCRFDGMKPARQNATQMLEFTCPRR